MEPAPSLGKPHSLNLPVVLVQLFQSASTGLGQDFELGSTSGQEMSAKVSLWLAMSDQISRDLSEINLLLLPF